METSMHISFFNGNLAENLTSISTLLRVTEAYLDPGSGSYLLQLLIAGLLGSLFVIRASWGKIKGFFRGLFGRQEEIPTDEE
jgi:hypothetical protein